MKSKVLRILLVAMVLAVWGAVLKRAFVRPDAMEEVAPVALRAAVQPVRNDTAVPRYTLARDPFRDRGPVVTHHTSQAPRTTASSANKPATLEVRAPSTPWPTITINGIFRPTDGAQYVATATINGKGHVLRAGQRAGDVLVQAITRDSVRLELNGVQRSLPASDGW
jgi:hypothetical protein